MAEPVVLTFPKEAVNPPLLHEELAAVLGADFLGVSYADGSGEVQILHVPGLAQSEIDKIEPVIVAHDSGQQTVLQQQEAAQEAIADRLRGKAWAEWTVTDKDDLLWLVAAQIGLEVM